MSIIGCGSRGEGCGLDTPWNFQNIHLGEQHLNIFDIIRGIFVCTFQNFPSLVDRALLYLNRMKVHLCFDVNPKLAVGILFFIISMQNNNKLYVWHVLGSVGNKSDSYLQRNENLSYTFYFSANIFEHVLSTNWLQATKIYGTFRTI